VLAATLAAAGALTVSGVSSAAPHHNRGLTIKVMPNPIIAGQEVTITGQLVGPRIANQPIVLYHRIPPRPFFTIIDVTKTDSNGFYSFIRPEGVVLSDRSWFVRGPRGTHSETVHEHVQALVSLAASTTDAITGQTVLFSGHVSPGHPFRRVLLQEQNSISGDGWATIASTFTGGGSNFVIPHRWARPGDYTLRAVFPRDARNDMSASDQVTVDVQQRQRTGFTITSSAPIIVVGQSVTITGALAQTGATTVPVGTNVTLWARQDGGVWRAQATTGTASDGSYSFTQSPTHNTAYQVRTTMRQFHATAVLYEGVQDAVTLTASSLTGSLGSAVTLNGTVTPAHPQHLIYLQRLGIDGDWHTVAATQVQGDSSFSFSYQLAQPGPVQLRARITGGPENVGAASPSVVITVSGVSAAILRTAS
jgi:hypothetical protein